MPWEAWYFGRGAKPGAPSPFKWTYHFGFGVGEFYKTYVSLWSGSVETNKKVGVLYPNDADGNAIREHLAPELAKAGFTIIDPGPYEDGTTDYSAQIAKFKAEHCEILTRSRSRRTSRPFGVKPRNRAIPRSSRSRKLPKRASSLPMSKRSVRWATIWPAAPIGIGPSPTNRP